MCAPQRFVVQLEHQIVRRVVHHADLFEHHFALELEVVGAQRRPEDEIGEHVRRLLEMVVEHARLIRRVLPRGIRVE